MTVLLMEDKEMVDIRRDGEQRSLDGEQIRDVVNAWFGKEEWIKKTRR